MGKLRSSSWLTAVRRAFRSPSKDKAEKSSRRREDPEPDGEEKRREKRRWLFRKAAPPTQEVPAAQVKPAAAAAVSAEQRHAIALAAAEVAKVTRPGPGGFVKEHCAAIAIQTCFRGYLARRALRALRGLVKLQALVRGHNVRKQTKMTLRCMQALVRVQTSVRDQRTRLSHEGCGDRSRYHQEMAGSRSTSRGDDESSFANAWDERQTRKDDALMREKALSYAFSHQIWRSDRNLSEALQEEEEEAEQPLRLGRWVSSRASFDHHRSRARLSTDHRGPIKIVPSSYSTPANVNPGRPQTRHSPATPSPCKASPILQVRSASPRCSSTHTPSIAAFYSYAGFRHQQAAMPNYMAVTESARARVRSQSAPKQRLAMPERDRPGSAKKRLSYPAARDAAEQQSNVSSCADSFGGEISPSSTADLRRWLR